MVYRPPVVVYDACVLYPFHLHNLLIQCGVDRLVDPHWSDAINEEWIAALERRKPGSRPALLRVRAAMETVLPQANVRGYEHRIDSIDLPDANDRHVVAAAIHAGASMIVTWNIGDFPAAKLRRHGMRCRRPSAFLTDLYRAMPELVLEVVANARRNLTLSALSPRDYVAALRRQRLARFAGLLATRLDRI